jgi:uncharacterized metal-binding protein YceD (DUF177 family)
MGRRDYEIAFVGLKPGIHEYEYLITDKFFEAYQQQDFHHCEATVKLCLDKHPSFMMLKFEIGGRLEVTCDRCGNSLPLELWDEFNIVVKLADDHETMNLEEEDPDVYYIARTESHLHVQDWMYEFINLSIPMQKMCSEEEMGGPQCNKDVLEMLKKLESGQADTANPIWKDLDKIKGLE